MYWQEEQENRDSEEVRRLYAALDSSGVPFALGFFPEGAAPPLPYGCYLPVYGKSFGADGGTYASSVCWQIELYTEKPEPETERRLETALEEYQWDKRQMFYLAAEHIWQTVYTVWI